MPRPLLLSLAGLFCVVLTGCGASFRVAAVNETDEAVRLELIEEFAGDSSVWMSATLSPRSQFTYAMHDGYRPDARYACVTPVADGHQTPVRIEISECGVTRFVIRQTGERLTLDH